MTTELRSVPRAPGRVPLLGHLLRLTRSPFAFVEDLRNSGEIVRVDLGTSPVYFLTTSDLVHELLVGRARDFEKGRLIDRARPFTGNGLLNSDNQTNRQRRRLMQPMFHRARIEGYAAGMAEQALAVAESWEPGRVVEVDSAMYEISINTVMTTLFSTEADAEAIEVIRHQVPVLLKGVLARAALPAAVGRLPVRSNRRFDRAVTMVRQVVDELVATARKSGADSPDLLSTLAAARDADTGEALTEEEIRDELITMLIGGTETTATTLTWTFHELAHNPEAEKRALAEIDAVVGDGPVGLAEIAELPFLTHVVDEVARLHAIPVLMRRAIHEVELGGVRIPAGTELAFSPYALHRDPRLYTDPDRFDPERWADAGRRTRAEFIPFSTGARKCIGEAYARMEMSVVLATVLARWQLRPASDRAVREVVAAVPRPDQLPMTPIARLDRKAAERRPKQPDLRPA
ncbi:MAG: cytochrome P450 [Streptomycetaceae bacterium]|nr:cytochrome P450 [Streptomycetaceae bacterium]